MKKIRLTIFTSQHKRCSCSFWLTLSFALLPLPSLFSSSSFSMLFSRLFSSLGYFSGVESRKKRNAKYLQYSCYDVKIIAVWKLIIQKIFFFKNHSLSRMGMNRRNSFAYLTLSLLFIFRRLFSGSLLVPSYIIHSFILFSRNSLRD